MSDNVDLFADVAAALFAQLHAAFPVPVDIEVDMLVESALGSTKPAGATQEAFVEATLLWLGNARLITFESGQLGARMVERVGLTARGFLALQAMDEVDEGMTIGRRLAKPRSDDERRSLVDRAISRAS
ncbi:hypothetical protein [Methylopila turkensis]|uniref:Uncharacterized protein n=1 Tax=Methylopila turkensis TaxID=1437816 RepID=A0A9W6N8Q0_9HYPH|nr:hypothetical protein [Methylopila turkensis]GLK81760.1 hypothetical protein GCM10008174_35010 [Methylopila turkensis]